MPDLKQLEHSQKYVEEVKKLREGVKIFVEEQLKKLDPLENLVYNFIFHDVFIDTDLENMLVSLRDELRSKEAEHKNGENSEPSSLYNYIYGWVHGRIDTFKGNKKICDDPVVSNFTREVIDLVKPSKLIVVHINVLCEYVHTQQEVKMLKEKYDGQKKQ